MNKITDAQIEQYGVQASPDKLQGTAAENKQVFDRLITNAVKASVNGIIDDISAATGAALIGALKEDGTTASTVQAELLRRVVAETGKGLSANDFTNTLKSKLDALPEGSNILATDNTTAFTPSGDYNPSTKKYVDDKAINAGAMSSFNERHGDVTPQAGDYTASQITYGESNVGASLDAKPDDGSEMLLTGYEKPASSSDIAATDSVNAAIGKLEARNNNDSGLSVDANGIITRVVGGTTEYLNPPLALETEYRTTERCEGRPIFIKRMYLGQFTQNKTITVLPDGADWIRSFTGEIGGLPTPVVSQNSLTETWTSYLTFYPLNSVLQMKGGSGNQSYTYITMKYTKTGI